MNFSANSPVSHYPLPTDTRHLLTVVVEDYCHPAGLRRVLSPGHWHRFESRVERNTDLTLDLLDEVNAKATFFILGWIAEHQPEVVRKIVGRGHEIASKGYFHRSIRDMSRAEFAEDVVRSREALERAGGVEVRGYRIPLGWFSNDDMWGLEELAKAGYLYDSSLRPFGWGASRHDADRFVQAHVIDGHPIWEVPVSAMRFGRVDIPISGGNFMRQLPEGFIRWSWERWCRRVRKPLVFYFHIWELDPDQPRITAVPMLQRIRQYRNLAAMEQRVSYYLSNYRFAPIGETLGLPPARPVTVAPPTAAVAQQYPVTPDTARTEPRLKISVAVPCYNEEATIGYLSNTLAAFGKFVADQYDVIYILVDDGSSDDTWARMNAVFGGREDCILVRHESNRGVAAATMTGIRNSPTDIVCSIDCDGTYDPKQLRYMIPMLTPGVDIVTASPYHRNGRVLNLPVWRFVLSRGLSLLYQTVLTNKIATYTSCFRVYRRRAIVDLPLKYEGFVGITEIVTHVDLHGGRIAEYPATMEVRLLGSSKMKVLKTIWGHLKMLAHLSLEQVSQAVKPNHFPRRGLRP